MKNQVFQLSAFLLSALLYSCAPAERDRSVADEPAVTDTGAQPSGTDNTLLLAEGRTLIEGSDCRACHANDQRMVGPSYVEVAERYHDQPEAVDMLAQKIIEGGAGNWGEIPMSPHPQVSQEDARKMVHYILSLHNGGAPQTN
jgi:cytochrome c